MLSLSSAILWALLWVFLVLIGVAIIVIVYLNIRARRLSHHIGMFRAWSRQDTHSGWVPGLAQYGVDTLSWYRLVALSNRPVYVLPRGGLTLSGPLEHSIDGQIVEVRIKAGEKRYELAVTREDYNGIVSWIESGPPRAQS
ncbi:DUF2550 domain-containing protein [Schaalia sp. ZJ405]|uniref:DUF2550 family protein n=1 Tax=unclassified Schaalia TaxID=2691889 RepID=UPI0013ED3DB7|nr:MULTISPECIES: DUF2550 family protein [unclassified Schaalia]QPK80613.1 DUF2550 domain-containing protein [Schaalia sp. ZJ405]